MEMKNDHACFCGTAIEEGKGGEGKQEREERHLRNGNRAKIAAEHATDDLEPNVQRHVT